MCSLFRPGGCNFRGRTREWKGNLLSIFSFYIETILKCGVLLDEDLAILLTYCNPIEDTNDSLKSRVIVGSSVVSSISCTVLAIYFFKPLLLGSVFLSIPAIMEGIQMHNTSSKKSDLVNIIESARRLHKVNLNTMRFLQLREQVKSTSHDAHFFVVNQNLRDYLEMLSLYERELFKVLAVNVNYCAVFFKNVEDDISYLDDIDFEVYHMDLINARQCISLVEHCDNTLILLMSKYLCYVALFSCPEQNTASDFEINSVLQKVVTDVWHRFHQVEGAISSRFRAIKFSFDKMTPRKSDESMVEGKLQQALLDSTTKLSVIVELAEQVLMNAESTAKVDYQKLSDSILELKNQTYSTYESLDVLCRMYGIMADQTKSASQISTPHHKQISFKEKTINFDDEREIKDEKLEMYVSADEPDISSIQYMDNTLSSSYLDIMLDEIKQALREHDKFIEARKKWVEDGDDTTPQPERSKPRKLDASTPIQAPIVTILPDQRIPTPPPIPSPHFQNDETSQESLFESIKARARQRDEEVFGDDEDDEDSSITLSDEV